MAGRSTQNNPGALNPRTVRKPRAIVAHAARAVGRRHFGVAAANLVADAINLLELGAGNVLPARFRCTCCGYTAHSFHHLVARSQIAWNSACPRCDSRSRHRGLAVLLPQLVEQHHPARALHFAPEPVLRNCFEIPGLRYETADLFLEDVTHTHVDLNELPFANGSYDLVVCNHVLEHLPSDEKALNELARIVSRGGVAVITVPGDFRREATRHFTGTLENGHYREYGMDLVSRLRTCFPNVEALDLHELDLDPSGLSRAIRPFDLAFVCRS